MKKFRIFFPLFFLFIVFSSNADAFLFFKAGADVGYSSEYMWRGMHATDDCIQGDLYLKAFGFSFTTWCNYELTDQIDYRGKISEIRYIFGYEKKRSLFTYQLGYIFYQYPKFERFNTQEIYLGTSLNLPFHPYLLTYIDIDEQGGAYFDLGLKQGIHLFGFGINGSVSIGFSAGESGSHGYYDGDGPTHLLLSFSLDWPVFPFVKLSPFVNGQLCIDNNTKHQGDVSGNDFIWWGGLNLSVSF